MDHLLELVDEKECSSKQYEKTALNPPHVIEQDQGARVGDLALKPTMVVVQ